MTSMRKLRRRLQRWHRYDDRFRSLDGNRFIVPPGLTRAARAVETERSRRNPYYDYGPCFCIGCIGSGRCDDERWQDFDDSVCECDSCQLADLDEDDAWDEAWAPMAIVTVPDVSTWEVP